MEHGSELLLVCIVAIIPIVAIVGNIILKFKKIELENKRLSQNSDVHMQELSSEMLKELKTLRTTNDLVLQRLQKVEKTLGQGEALNVYGELGARDSISS